MVGSLLALLSRLEAAVHQRTVYGTQIIFSGTADLTEEVSAFDMIGFWGPSLVFVMGGAIVTAFYRLSTGVAPDRSGNLGIAWRIAGFRPEGALRALRTVDGNVGVLRRAPFLITGRWEQPMPNAKHIIDKDQFGIQRRRLIWSVSVI